MSEHCDFENECDFIDADGFLHDCDRSDLVTTKNKHIKTLKEARKWMPCISESDLPIIVKQWKEDGALKYDVFCADFGHLIHDDCT
jgi:hypothetical protein